MYKKQIHKISFLKKVLFFIALFLVFLKTSMAKAEVLKMDFTSLPECLDPAANMNTGGWYTLNNISLTLFEVKDNQALKGLLAEKWQSFDQGKRHVIYLRKDAYFHNGRNITADDVIYSLKRKQNLWPEYTIFDWIDLKNENAIQKKSDYVVEFHLKKPYDFFLFLLALPGSGVVPKEKYDFYKPCVKSGLPDLAGAYKVIEWKKKDYIKLQLFERWFVKYDKAPREIIIFFNSPDKLKERFLTGETNFILDFFDIVGKDKASDFSKKFNEFQSNLNSILFAYLNVKEGPFQSKEIRKTFAAVLREFYSIEAKDYANVSLASEFYPDAYSGQTHNVKLPKLEEHLDTIEFLKKNPIKIRYLSSYQKQSPKFKAGIRHLKNFGFEPQLKVVENSGLRKKMRLQSKGYDVGLWMIPLLPVDPCLVYRIDFGPDDFYIQDPSQVLPLLMKNCQSVGRIASRINQAKKINDYFNEELLIIPLLHRNIPFYSSKEFDLQDLPRWSFNFRFGHIKHVQKN